MIEEGTIKISDLYLNEISTKSVLNFFGDWINQIDFLRNSFLNAQPFEHLIIDNFLEESYAEKISNLFPNLDDLWHKYENPIEVKYTYDDINFLDIELKNYFYYLSTEEVINLIKSISNIRKPLIGIHLRSTSQKMAHESEFLSTSYSDRLLKMKEKLDNELKEYSIFVITDTNDHLDLAKSIFGDIYYFDRKQKGIKQKKSKRRR